MSELAPAVITPANATVPADAGFLVGFRNVTRGDAEKMLSDLIKRGRRQTDSLLKELERLVKQARKEVHGRSQPVRKQATQAARRAAKKLG